MKTNKYACKKCNADSSNFVIIENNPNPLLESIKCNCCGTESTWVECKKETITDICYEGKALVNDTHVVKFEYDEYYSTCKCPYCKEGYLKTYWNNCPICGTEVEFKEVR